MSNQALLERKPAGEIGLIGHIIANYPSRDDVQELVSLMRELGVALCEVQIPFSEPIADGPLFMAANHAALAAGTTVADCLQLMTELAGSSRSAQNSAVPMPLVFMTYANVVFRYGPHAFFERARDAGAQGLLIPDWPLDDAGELIQASQEFDVPLIPVVAPNTAPKRLEQILKVGGGFVYLVARSGVTGTSSETDPRLAAAIDCVRDLTDLPIAVGFGIRSREQVLALAPTVDYAIVGSASLRAFQAGGLAASRRFWLEILGEG